MRRALLRELGHAGRADAWRAASASQASALAHEHRGVASLAGWRAAAAGARVLQPVLTPPHGSLLPPALAVSLHARWNSAAAPPLPPTVVPEAAHTGSLLADTGGGCDASEVATIAGESNLGIASLQYMVEWFHVSCDLPWCVAPPCAAVDATDQVAQVARHCGLDVDAAHDDHAAHSIADEEHGEALGAPDRGSGSSVPFLCVTLCRLAARPARIGAPSGTLEGPGAIPATYFCHARSSDSFFRLCQMGDPDAVSTFQREVAAIYQKCVTSAARHCWRSHVCAAGTTAIPSSRLRP